LLSSCINNKYNVEQKPMIMKKLVFFMVFDIFRVIALLLISSAFTYTIAQNNQYLVASEELGIVNDSQVKSTLQAYNLYKNYMNLGDIIIYKIIYNTIDVFGNSTVASGAVYVPYNEINSFPMVSYQHGTELNRNVVPSRRDWDPIGYIYAGNGYITVFPDYLGMGDNPGIQSYIHWRSEATASLDLIRATREFLNDSIQIQDNDQLFITGYSQGGHSTMALHKYIQSNNLYDEFNIISSAPMSGPYSLSSAQFDHMFNADSTYEGTVFLPLAFASFQYIYGNLYSDHSQYYDSPYDSIFASWESTGIYYPNNAYYPLPANYYAFMQDSVVDNFMSNINHPFRRALRDNDLDNWDPQKPVRMLYGGKDLIVPPSNATVTNDKMNTLGAPNVEAIEINASYNHSTCHHPAHFYTLQWFDSLAVKQSNVNINVRYTDEITLYPNPSSGLITVLMDYPDQIHYEIYSLNGQQILSGIFLGKEEVRQLDLKAINKGVYFITIRSKDFVTTRKIIKL
jgi:pimeloyl-ACP methyl ester carboxylesterase